MSKRIYIRASVYRDVAGFTVNAGPGVNIFCTTRAMAEEYRDMLRQDLPRDEMYKRSYEILCGQPSGAGPSAHWAATHS